MSLHNLAILGPMEAELPYKPLSAFKSVKAEDINNLCRHVPIQNAVDEWLPTIPNPESRRKYTLGINRLFQEPERLFGISLTSSISGLDGNNVFGLYDYLLRDFPEGKYIRQLCASTFYQLSFYTAKQTFGRILPSLRPIETAPYSRATDLYPKVNWENFMCMLPPPYDAIAQIIFVMGMYGFRARVTDSKDNVLTLTNKQIDFKENHIHFHERQGHVFCNFTIPFQKEILAKLNKNASPDERVFPVHVRSLNRMFEKQSHSVLSTESITPLILSWAGMIAGQEKRRAALSRNKDGNILLKLQY